jgi:hypothetical protein
MRRYRLTADDLCDLLIAKCLYCCAATGLSRSALSRKLANDPNFLARLERTRNLRFKTHDAVMLKLDELLGERRRRPRKPKGAKLTPERY